ncbi:MAG TPA: hypothetical protein DCX94_04970 [Alteromonas macleodii]|nr:hypothetical protein [Alteromonas macleodii]HAX27266.1 hypothetical protein [Alteromonas macleodii]
MKPKLNTFIAINKTILISSLFQNVLQKAKIALHEQVSSISITSFTKSDFLNQRVPKTVITIIKHTIK